MNIDDVLKGHGIGVGGGSNIKSIQTGVVPMSSSTTQTINITNVDLSKSVAILSATETATTATLSDVLGSIEIISSNQIKIKRYGTQFNATFYWTVIEFTNIKSFQTGLYTGTGDITVTSVNPSKTLIFSSCEIPLSGGNVRDFFNAIYLYDSTTLRFITGYGSSKTRWYAIEFN